jgi:LysM repeat protein
MVLSIVKVNELPLGRRNLCYGCNGEDVKELQKSLRLAGFYFGEMDGRFGMLTGEAVALFQRTFHLKVDSVAGRQVFNVLNHDVAKKGRIIYTVKKNEGLNNISKRFAVTKSAWQRIPGQGSPQLKIYPGMKMLLYEKTFYGWDMPEGRPLPFPLTGMLRSDYRIGADGGLEYSDVNGANLNTCHLISAEKEVWAKVLGSKKIWSKLVLEIRNIKTGKYGIDLRQAPSSKLIHWGDLLKFLCRELTLPKMKLLVLPFLIANRKPENQLFWLNLPLFGSLTKNIMVEPVYDTTMFNTFEISAVQMFKDLKRLIKMGLAGKTLLVEEIAGWDWNMELHQWEKLPFKVAKLIRAQYNQPIQSGTSILSKFYYSKHNVRHCLIYRDEENFRELLNRIIKLNLAGVVIRGFEDLGESGPEWIAGSFKVLQDNGN